MGRRVLVAAIGLGGLVASGRAAGQTHLNQEEALALAFPKPAVVERHTAFLSDEQLAAARRMAGREVEIDQRVVTSYVGRRDTAALGVAYFDAHRVRTLPEVMMVVVAPDGRVTRIEILRFAEPPEYRAPDGWLKQLEGQELGPDLSLRGRVVGITGATLTARAVVQATRRVLALHQVIAPFAGAAQ